MVNWEESGFVAFRKGLAKEFGFQVLGSGGFTMKARLLCRLSCW
jgi:hypothetical protein